MAENDEIISYIKRAFELREQECYKQAIEMLYKAIAIVPDSVDIMFQLGELYYLLDNYPRALQFAEQILELENNNLQALKLLKKIYLKQNELYSAKEIVEKIYKFETNEDNLVVLTDVYGKLEMFDEIELNSQKFENSEKCLYAYAKNLYNHKLIDRAEHIVDKILNINPDNEDGIILKGKILFDKNEIQKSKGIFSKFDKYTQNSEALNYKGLFALDELNFGEAIKYFSKASSYDKKNSLYLYNLGNAYFFNGWYEEAVNAYKSAILLNPENAGYRYALAYIYYEYKEFDKAKKEVESILSIDNNNYQAKVLKALLLCKDGKLIEAEKILQENMSLGVCDEFTISSLATVELELGKYQQAEEHLKSLLENKPFNTVLTQQLCEVYIKEKSYDKALELAENITNNDQNSIDGNLLGAKAALYANKFELVKNYAQEILSKDINCAEGYYYLAMARKFEKDYPEAIECMKRAILHDLNNAGYYAVTAELYKLSGDNETAFEYIKEAESIDNSEEYKRLFKEYAALNRK